jgi:hypothetical protein
MHLGGDESVKRDGTDSCLRVSRQRRRGGDCADVGGSRARWRGLGQRAGRTHLFQVRECAADTSVRSDDGACAGLDRGAAPVGRRAAVEPCVPRRDPGSARTGWSKDRSGQSDEDGRDCGGDRGRQVGVGAVVRSGNAGDSTRGPTSRWRAPYHPELRGCRPRFESGSEQSARRSARFSSIPVIWRWTDQTLAPTPQAAIARRQADLALDQTRRSST